MNKREEIKKILDSVIPNNVSSLYGDLIKLIDLYNLKYYYLGIKNKEQLELVSTIDIKELKEIKKLLMDTENERTIQRDNFVASRDFGGLNLLINKSDELRRKISVEEEKIDNWFSNEVQIDEFIKDILIIVKEIELKLKEIRSLNLFEDKRRIDDLYVGERHRDILNSVEGLSNVESSTLFFIIKIHIDMWKSSFSVAEDIAVKIIESYKGRKLINVDDFNFSLVYSSAILCNADSNYEVLLDSIFNHSSEEEFTASNDRNTIIAKEVLNFLSTGLISEKFVDEFKDISYVDEHYLWMYSLMMKNKLLKQKVKNRL